MKKKLLVFLLLFFTFKPAYSGFEEAIKLKEEVLSELDKIIDFHEKYVEILKKNAKEGRDVKATIESLKELNSKLDEALKKLKQIDPNFFKEVKAAIEELRKWEGWILTLDKQSIDNTTSSKEVTQLKNELKLIENCLSKLDKASQVIDECKESSNGEAGNIGAMLKNLEELNSDLYENLKRLKEIDPNRFNKIEAEIEELNVRSLIEGA